jgi:hypothetical protein
VAHAIITDISSAATPALLRREREAEAAARMHANDELHHLARTSNAVDTATLASLLRKATAAESSSSSSSKAYAQQQPLNALAADDASANYYYSATASQHKPCASEEQASTNASFANSANESAAVPASDSMSLAGASANASAAAADTPVEASKTASATGSYENQSTELALADASVAGRRRPDDSNKPPLAAPPPLAVLAPPLAASAAETGGAAKGGTKVKDPDGVVDTVVDWLWGKKASAGSSAGGSAGNSGGASENAWSSTVCKYTLTMGRTLGCNFNISVDGYPGDSFRVDGCSTVGCDETGFCGVDCVKNQQGSGIHVIRNQAGREVAYGSCCDDPNYVAMIFFRLQGEGAKE